MKLTEHDKRALGALHRGAWPQKTSNFDKPERRVRKLVEAGLVSGDGKLTEAGRAMLRAHYLETGLEELAERIEFMG